jgi:hypothetical protein
MASHSYQMYTAKHTRAQSNIGIGPIILIDGRSRWTFGSFLASTLYYGHLCQKVLYWYVVIGLCGDAKWSKTTASVEPHGARVLGERGELSSMLEFFQDHIVLGPLVHKSMGKWPTIARCTDRKRFNRYWPLDNRIKSMHGTRKTIAPCVGLADCCHQISARPVLVRFDGPRPHGPWS